MGTTIGSWRLARRIVVLAAFAMVSLPLPAAQGQDAEAMLTGVVRNVSGLVIAGAKVTLTNERTSATQSTVTSSEGKFAFGSLDPGTYTLRAESPGFQSDTRLHITVSREHPVSADFSLQPESRAIEKTDSSRAGAGSLSSRVGYYDKLQMKSSAVSGAIDPGGYSSPGQARATNSMLQAVLRLKKETGPGGNGIIAERTTQTEPSEDDLFDSGSGLLLDRRVEPAIDIFARGVGRYPRSARLEIGLGVALYAGGRYDEAIKALCAASDLAPSDPRPYFFLGRLDDVSATSSDEVTKRLERFLTLQPQSGPAHYYYATNLWKRQRGGNGPVDSAQIELLLKSAIALDPTLADAHLALGSLFADRQKYAEAIPEYQQAIKLDPDLADAHYRLAQAYTRTGEQELASREFTLHDQLRKQQTAEWEKQRAEIKQLVNSAKEPSKP